MLKNKRTGILIIIILSLFVLIAVMISVRCRSTNKDSLESVPPQTETESAQSAAETTAAPPPETEPETEPAKPELPEKENLAGRLIIEELDLDCYVMRGDEYLDLDNDGNKAVRGSLYIPGYSTEDCIFINGHTMKDGSMFGSLYQQRDNLIGMRVILQDEYREARYQIIKTYIVSGTDEKLIKALSADGYKGYLTEHQDLELTGTVLSLMCCEYSREDGRLFVVAKELD